MKAPKEVMDGKVVLVTGGIGKDIAEGLASMGASVVVVGRNRSKGVAALTEIKARSGNEAVVLMVADLSSQAEIHRLAREFEAHHDRLDVLINNAGALYATFAYSRVPAYQTLGFQLPVGAACLALFFSTLVVFPAAFLVRRRRGAPPPPRAARLVAGLAGALNLGLLVWFVLSLLGFAETYVWPAEAVAMITRLWLLGVPLTLVVVLSVLAWKKGYWGAA